MTDYNLIFIFIRFITLTLSLDLWPDEMAQISSNILLSACDGLLVSLITQ